MSLLLEIAARIGRAMLLTLFAAAGTILLVRYAPGFFSDTREMDARYGAAARAEMQAAMAQQSINSIAAVPGSGRADAIAGWNAAGTWQLRDDGPIHWVYLPIVLMVTVLLLESFTTEVKANA